MDRLNNQLFHIFKGKIEGLIKYDISEKNRAYKNFDNFLSIISDNSLNIVRYLDVNTPKRKNHLRIWKQYPDLKLELVILKDLTSEFRVIVSKISIEYFNDTYMINKVEPQYGFVYFLKCEFGYKIGYTAKLQNRLRDFGVKLPFKFHLDSTVRTIEYKSLEKKLHSLLQHKGINGEWFDLNDEDFIHIDKILSNMGMERIMNRDIIEQ